MLELKNVSKYYYKKGMITSGFSKVNLKFNIGEFVAITGESGSGKSTLLNVISGLDTYEDGEMYINGEETSYYTEKDYEKYRKKYIGNIFQSFNLVNSYTVYQNVELICLLNGFKRKEVKEKVLELIEKVGLTKYKNKKVSKLSGGQKQRVAIARAFAQETPIILADEPTGNLDKASSEKVLEILHEISREKLVIVVTHNYDQIEKYVTRKITMHDGKVIEDRKIKKTVEPDDITYAKSERMTWFNRIRVGIRNAFNIPSKLLIIGFVYLFVVLSLFAVYGNFVNNKDISESEGYNYFFNTSELNRIILKKNNKTAFTEDDYNKLSKMNNIEKIIKEDLLIDKEVFVSNNKYYLYGYAYSYKDIKKVDYGRLPKEENEVILGTSMTNNYFNEDDIEELLKQDFDTTVDNKEVKLKIVGIISLDDDHFYDQLYYSDSMLEKINNSVYHDYTTIKYTFLNNTYQHYSNAVYNELIPSNKVPSGKAVVSDNYQWECKNFNCRNYSISITSKNLYSTINKTLYVSNMYNKNNFSNLTGYAFDKYDGAIFINTNDFNNLFDKNNYQSSVYVSDETIVENTIKELNDMGYKTLYIRDTLAGSNDQTTIRVMNILKLIVNIVAVVVLFFISYFIIKLVLKSRNIYYSTLRILGSTLKDTKKLLNIELFTIANISYLIFIGLVLLNYFKVIKIGFIYDGLKYMEIYHYIIIYVLVCLMTLLTTERYSRKLFVDSVMNTYREEV